ncbi:MAG: hypothetical protein U0946_06075, partial [Patescibacteria group bacterium]|nr:hypothetical protein [Patescibacteria group bacterium]
MAEISIAEPSVTREPPSKPEKIWRNPIRINFPEQLGNNDRRINKQWTVITEIIRRQLNDNNNDKERNGLSGNIRSAILPLVKVVADEQLPFELIKILIENPDALSGRLTASLLKSKDLIDYLKQPSIPEEEYAFYRGLQPKKSDSPEKAANKRIVLRRSIYAREVKLLALGAELYSLDKSRPENRYELETPNGIKMKLNPNFDNLREKLINPLGWEFKKQIKDRVHIVTIAGKEYILKEQKTKRHKDVRRAQYK